jgi:hypothetical protein
MSNQKKSEQLGMSFGKASHILRKSIIFNLAKKCGMSNCYQCGEEINDINNFSIEHKEPWLDSENPEELFFDINNIAFSHHSCNISAARRPDKTLPRNIIATCGFKGVHYYGNLKKPYRACIKIDGKTKWLGCYLTAEEAATAHDIEAVKQFGDKAITNRSMGLIF